MFHGLGIGMLLVSTFSDALKTAVAFGFREGLETYGIVSGLWTSIFAFGAFVGPSASGALYDAIGFTKSVYFIIIWHAVVVLVFVLFLCCSSGRPKKMYKEISSTENIVKKSRDDLIRSVTSLEGSRTRNSSFSSIPVPIERGCAMNNLIMASSYGNKGNHWQRLEESNGLLQDPTRDDTISAYGSFDIDYDAHRETRGETIA